MTKTLRTVWLSAAVRSPGSPDTSAPSMPYAFETPKAASPMIG
jgi:hypothetical protein